MLTQSNENNHRENQSDSHKEVGLPGAGLPGAGLPGAGEVHRSRWGYYPYDYETYLKLKQLNRIYYKALKQSARWERWARKAPQNRVYRKHIPLAVLLADAWRAPRPGKHQRFSPG